LHWCELGTKATKMIFEGVGKNKWLKVLDISWNQIGLDSVPAFCTCNSVYIKLLETITVLSIWISRFVRLIKRILWRLLRR
jgi:hypothetical protein